MATRILQVLKEDRPYEIWDVDGQVLTKQQARQTIVENGESPKRFENVSDEKNRTLIGLQEAA